MAAHPVHPAPYHLSQAIASLTEIGPPNRAVDEPPQSVGATSTPLTLRRPPTPLSLRAVVPPKFPFPLMVKYVGHEPRGALREAEKVLVENNVVKEAT